MKWIDNMVKWNDDKMVVVLRMKYGKYGCMEDGRREEI